MNTLAARYTVVCALAALLMLGGCAYGNQIEKGDAYLEQGQLEEALHAYQSAQQIDPDAPEAHDKIAQTRERLADDYCARGEAFLAQNDLFSAIGATSKAYEFHAQSRCVAALVERVSERGEREADAANSRDDWGYALAIFEAISEHIPPKRTIFGQKASAARAAWTDVLLAGAREAEDADLEGLALLYWGKAFQLSSLAEARVRFTALRQKLRAGSIYLARVDGDRDSEAFGVIAASLAPPPASTLRIETQKSDAKIDAEVEVTLSAPTFETSQNSRSESLTYQSGTRMVKNHAYDRAQNDLTSEERQLVTYQRDRSRAQSELERARNAVARQEPSDTKTYAEYALDRAQADAERARDKVATQRDRVQYARENLAATEPYVEEPVYRTLQYAITTHYRSAVSIAAVHIEHRDGRAAIQGVYTLHSAHQDDAHRAYPEAGLGADPLMLASERDLRARIFADAVEPIAREIEKSFEGWRDGILKRGIEAETNRERVDIYVKYILTNPNSVDREVGVSLPILTGIPDALEILRP